LTLASVGMADPAIYKNKPIFNRLMEHYNLSVFTLVSARVIRTVKGSRLVNARPPSAVIAILGHEGRHNTSMRSVPLVALLYKRVPANCSSGTAGCGACHVRNIMIGPIVFGSSHRRRVWGLWDLILLSASNHLTRMGVEFLHYSIDEIHKQM